MKNLKSSGTKKTWWVKNTEGKPDAMLTFALFSFVVITLNIFLSTFGVIQVGEVVLNFQSLDSSVMAVYLASTFTAYVSRRFTDKKYSQENENGSDSSSSVASGIQNSDLNTMKSDESSAME